MKHPLKTIRNVLSVCAVVAVSAAAYRMGGVWTAVAAVALGILVALTVCTVRTPHDTENIFDRHKKASILLATVTGCVLVIACCHLPFLGAFSDGIIRRFEGADLFNYYTAQLSLTFISISVMSVLSDKSVIIYWANVSEDRLIRPTFYCFAAYTYYSIGATVGAGLGVVLNNAAVFIAFFAVNVGVMILLTISMIDVYYGRDTKKKKLAKTLLPYADRAAYESKILGLEQNVLRAADEKDVVFLREVYELCIDQPGRFDTDIGREAVSVMVSTLNAQTTGPFLRALDQSICEQLSRFPAKAGELIVVAFDSTLWSALCSERARGFLEQVSVTAEGDSSPNAMLFARVLMHRLTLEYNACAAYFIEEARRKGQEVDPALYYVSDNFVNSIYEPKTADGMPVSAQRFEEVLGCADRNHRSNTLLFASIIRLMDRVMKDGRNWFTVKQLAALPFVKHWASEETDLYDPDALARLTAIFDREYHE